MTKPGRASQNHRITGTFDFECADWDRFVVGATYDGSQVKIYRDPDSLIDDLRRRGGVWVAHAGGVYDLLLVLERARIRQIPWQANRSQHRISRVTMGKLTLRDSYGIWPAPLTEICGALGRRAAELPWACACTCTCGKYPCTCNKSCGAYCRIGEFSGDPDLDAYVSADVIDLYDGMRLLEEFAADHRIDLRGTIGQTAWMSARSEIGIVPSEMPFHLWRHARQGDKGGRIAVVHPISAGPGAHHDICNAYPAQLAKMELPVGSYHQLGAHGAVDALEELQPGIYTASVLVPEDAFIPPLPWSKGGRLTFPTGEFCGSWVLPELVAALERGVKLQKVHAAMVWETKAQVFGPLIGRWYEIRRKVGRKTPLGKWLGALPKALTGKLAERPDRQRIACHPEQIRLCRRKGACGTRAGCTGRCGAYVPMDLHGEIWGIPFEKMSDSAYPQWSAYLRAGTRIQWLGEAERMGRDLCLGNTDSLWHTSRQTPEPLGDGLGEWEFQHAWQDLEIRAPTVYAFRIPGKDKLEIRGVPGLTEEDWRRGRGMIDRGVVTFGRAVKSTHGLFHRRSRKWGLPREERTWYGDRKMGADGLTYPASADELRRLARRPSEEATHDQEIVAP